MSVNPWNIYAKELLPLGYGYPLWIPEPNEGQEVLIGDVGWFKAGAFQALFNSMRDGADPVNRDKGVPTNFQVFSEFKPNGDRKLWITRSEKITQEMVYSRSIKTRQGQGEIEATSPSPIGSFSAGVGWRFRTTSDTGAFALLSSPGFAEEIVSRQHIVKYMGENFDSWLELANSLDSWGLGLEPEEIVFVCGTLKTTSEWVVAAFQGDMFRDKDGYVAGQFGSVGGAQFSISFSNHHLAVDHYRVSPQARRPLSGQGHALESSGTSPTTNFATPPHPNQCLFVHYYKMKRRFVWKRPLQAAAGPHELPPGAPDGSQGAPGPMTLGNKEPSHEFEFGPIPNETYDPVTHLLDYILKTTEADIAIASDLDLISMFRERDFPHDIPEAIERLSPLVEVDENGGTSAN